MTKNEFKRKQKMATKCDHSRCGNSSLAEVLGELVDLSWSRLEPLSHAKTANLMAEGQLAVLEAQAPS